MDVDPVIVEPLTLNLSIIGRLVSLQAGTVAAETSGSIAAVAVEVGDRVATGQALARLDTSTLMWRLQSAKATVTERQARTVEAGAALRMAEAELKRLEKLRPSTAFPFARYEDKVEEVGQLQAAVQAAQAALEHARAEVRLAEIELAKAEIRAPYPGVVHKRHVEVGSYIAAGAEIVALVNDRNLEVEADVAAEHVADLTPGTGGRVRIGPDLTVPTTVRAVVPAEDSKTRTRVVRFTFDAPPAASLAANQSVVVTLQVGGRHKVPTVSKDAIISRGDHTIVFVIEESVAKSRTVLLGRGIGGRLTVEDGLKAGERVVVRGNETLRSGQTVRLLDGSAASGQNGKDDIRNHGKSGG